MASSSSADDVQLTDLEVIQQFSLAVRGATAPRAQVIAALESDLAYLTGTRRAPAKAPTRAPVRAPARAPAKAPIKPPVKAPVKAAAKKATSRVPAKKVPAKKTTRRA